MWEADDVEFLIKIRWHHLLKYFFVSAAPEAVAGNVVGLDDLPLTDQCRGVAVDQLHHPEDEGLAQPLVRIKTEAEVNLKTILWFLFFWHAKCILSCLSCSRSFCHYYFVLHTYRVSIKQYTIHFLLNKRLRLAAAMLLLVVTKPTNCSFIGKVSCIVKLQHLPSFKPWHADHIGNRCPPCLVIDQDFLEAGKGPYSRISYFAFLFVIKFWPER